MLSSPGGCRPRPPLFNCGIVAFIILFTIHAIRDILLAKGVQDAFLVRGCACDLWKLRRLKCVRCCYAVRRWCPTRIAKSVEHVLQKMPKPWNTPLRSMVDSQRSAAFTLSAGKSFCENGENRGTWNKRSRFPGNVWNKVAYEHKKPYNLY